MADYVVVDKEQLESDLTTVADTIRDKFELTEKLEFPDGMSEAIKSFALDEELTTQDALIEQIKTALQGKASGGESFWDMQTSIAHSFHSVDFGGGFELVLNLGKNVKNKTVDNGTAFQTAFSEAKGLKKVSIINHLTFSKPQSLITMFGCSTDDNELVEVDISSVLSGCKVNSFTNCFKFRKVLRSIIGVFDLGGITSANNQINPFQYCASLVDVRFKQNTINYNLSLVNSPLLSAETIQSVIDGLVDLTGGTSQTITLHTDVKAKLTETQIAQITSKNWTLA